MTKTVKSIAIIAIAFVMFVSASIMFATIADLRRNERWRADNAIQYAERRRQDDERNMYLMEKLPEYFAGSYYHPNWDDTPGRLRIFLTEGGLLAASELSYELDHFSGVYFQEHVGSYCLPAFQRRRVEFTYAQLLETQAAVIAAMEARPDCVYANNVEGPRISVSCNRVEFLISDLIQMDYREVIAGFRQYVYDSEMIDFRRLFHFPMGFRSRRENLTTIAISGTIFLATGSFSVVLLIKRMKSISSLEP